MRSLIFDTATNEICAAGYRVETMKGLHDELYSDQLDEVHISVYPERADAVLLIFFLGTVPVEILKRRGPSIHGICGLRKETGRRDATPDGFHRLLLCHLWCAPGC